MSGRAGPKVRDRLWGEGLFSCNHRASVGCPSVVTPSPLAK